MQFDEICENYVFGMILSDLLSGISSKGGDKSIINRKFDRNTQELKFLKSKRRLRLLIKRRSSTWKINKKDRARACLLRRQSQVLEDSESSDDSENESNIKSQDIIRKTSVYNVRAGIPSLYCVRDRKSLAVLYKR
jgi:hypothetical protein